MRGGAFASGRRGIEAQGCQQEGPASPEMDTFEDPFESETPTQIDSELLREIGATMVPPTQSPDQSSGSQRRIPRGPSRGAPTPADPDSRILLEVSDGSFVGTKPSGTISATLKQFFTRPWTSWKKIPVQNRDLFWDHFKTKFRWDAQIETVVREIWELTSAARLRDILCDARNRAKKRVPGGNLAACHEHAPAWMSPDIWRQLVDIWTGEEWQKISTAASRNRQTETGGTVSKHTGGSISFSTHKKRMSVQLGRPPTHLEVFERTHKKKGNQGTWVDSRSEQVYESYTQSVSRRFGDDPAVQPAFDPTSWVNVTGEPTWNRSYGFSPHLRRDDALGASSSSSVRRPESNESRQQHCVEIDELRAEVQRCNQVMDEQKEMMQQQREMMQQQMQQQREQMQEQRDELVQQRQLIQQLLSSFPSVSRDACGLNGSGS